MSLLTIENLTNKQIMDLIKRADDLSKGASSKLNLPVVNIFLEPSTRTLMSF
jgi:aspartate carbamoyltransferase catalytic subunit